jgi:L-ascorbate metabolism protein UlaG (beta-lactamase superfamily)
MDAPLCFRWLGVAGLELVLGDQVLMIDPFFTRPPLWRAWFGRVEPDRDLVAAHIERCDYLLVSHAHYDHLLDVPEVVRATSALALGSANTCRLLAVCGVPGPKIRRIAAGDVVGLGPFRIEVLPALHMPATGFSPGPLPPALKPPLRLRDYRMDDYFSFAIQAGGHRLLSFAGVRPEPTRRAEVLFVGPEKPQTYYEALLPAVAPQLVIPVHWDDFFRPLSKPLRPSLKPPRWTWPPIQRMDLARFKERVESIIPGTRVLVPEIFREYDLDKERNRS